MLRRVEIKTFTPNPAPNGSGVVYAATSLPRHRAKIAGNIIAQAA